MSDIIEAFNDIKSKPLPQARGIDGLDYLDRVASMQIGAGSKVFRGDQSGIWLGASKFADAPFSVDMDGNIVASTATFGQYISKAGTSQTLTGDFNLNDANVKIDGANKRILINDGTNDRILIGYQSGGF